MDKRFGEYGRLRRRLERVQDAQAPLLRRERDLNAKVWALLTLVESRFVREYQQDQLRAKPQRLIARELRKLRWHGRYVPKTRLEKEWNEQWATSARVVPLEEVPFMIAFCFAFASWGCTVRLHGRDYHVWMDEGRGLIRQRR